MLMFAATLIVLAAAAATMAYLANRRPEAAAEMGVAPAGLGRVDLAVAPGEIVAVRCSVMQLLGEVHEAVENRFPLAPVQADLRWEQLRGALLAVGAEESLITDLDGHFELAGRMDAVPSGMALLDADEAVVDAIGVLGERVARRSPVLVGRVAAGLPDTLGATVQAA